MSKKVKELENLTEKLSVQLADSLYNTLNILQNILDLTERYYENSHYKFVGEFSGKTAELMNLPEEEVFEIKTAGLLHDFGKIGFKDSALYKNTKDMSKKEYNQYKLHVNIGREILREHKNLRNIAEIVYQHHENYDGTGFPERLKKDEIHIGARIIRIVDFYHNAMHKNLKNNSATSDFNDRKENSNYILETQDKFEYTAETIYANEDNKFDTDIARAFVGLIESERKKIAGFIVKRVHLNNLKTGMLFAESYFSSSGLLIANKGEKVTNDILKGLYRCAESNQIPYKLLMLTEDDN